MVRRTVAAVQPRKPTNDAEAIAEAASRPTMRFVAVKSVTKQAAGLTFKTRDRSCGSERGRSRRGAVIWRNTV